LILIANTPTRKFNSEVMMKQMNLTTPKNSTMPVTPLRLKPRVTTELSQPNSLVITMIFS